MVKQSAILREQLGDFVYVVNSQNRIERRKIAIGMKHGQYQTVISGLKAGERVVVEGLQKAGSGDEVKPIAPQQAVPGKRPSVSPQEKAASGQQKKTEAKK